MKKLPVILSVIAILVAVTIMSTAVVGAQDNNARPNTSLFATKLASILGLSPASVSEAIKQTKEELRNESEKTQKHKYSKDIGTRLRKAIENGDITREEAAARIKGLESKRQQLQKNPNNFGHPSADDINKKLEALVQDGKITSAEADHKMRLYSEKAHEGWGFEARLRKAVENGNITREEAAARIKGLESGR